MRRSFVFKDKMGGTAGYLTQGLDAICCRVRDVESDAVAVLMYKDGRISRKELLPHGAESRWDSTEGDLAGAVIVSGDGITADTGGQARKLYEEIRRREHTESRRSREGKRTERSAEEEASRIEHAAQEGGTDRESGRRLEEYAFPQPRWPPPPCWNGAVYRAGRWQSE